MGGGRSGRVRVHVYFSMLYIFQIEQRLGLFSNNPTRYHKEFLHVIQAYALTWGDTYNIINDTLTEDKKESIWKAAEQHADQHPNRHTPCH
jgi:hypothetical protein